MTHQNQQVNHLFFVDISGNIQSSNSSVTAQVNDSIDSIRQSQENSKYVDHRITLFLLQNNNLNCIYSDLSIHDVQTFFFTPNGQNVIGQTLDAIGTSIATWRALNVRNHVKGKFQVTLFTSGRDRGSRKYTSYTLKSIIESLSQCDWQFTIVSSNALLPRIAAQLGVKNYYVCRNSQLKRDKNFLINQLKRQWVIQNTSVEFIDETIDHAA